VVAKHGETTSPTTTNMFSYANLLIMQRALELAGRNLTREGFLAAYDRIQNLEVGMIPPVSFGPGRHIGTTAMFPMQCCRSDNTWKGVGPSSTFGS
jgi:hypothetical protein